ncbi:TonB-dependent receptor [Arenibacter certesii]|uniref:TonB-dependent receptor n=1 Tax=Arenibacter certesii TaxID=228955 RepID=A0A918IVU0_9FLAO|nr:carboxypeptidase-like regulatory domain-containing protein [Arenibacter certesii]GGW34379.1 TonB-dependent receptor [Arenibacter certesii]
MKKFFVFALFCLPYLVCSQNVEGVILESDSGGKDIGLQGANIYWLNSQTGTISGEDGSFTIPFIPEHTQLVVSYVGFHSDTLIINEPQKLRHRLRPSNELEEVVVQKKRDALQKSYFSPQNVVTINSAELLKAACCNLSESFETNPSIDVNFSDALTGTKQIQMLGLTSPYLLITQENIPMVRGASQVYGLSFTPGTWVESIQITKGGGSVVNGYESISGQINAELVKPFTDKRLFVNGYANMNGRLELNTHVNHALSDKWSTGLYLHGNYRNAEEDGNKDGFLDAPLGNQINILNRWQYQNVEKGWVSFINVRFLNDEKQTGQTNFDPRMDKFTNNSWGSEIDTRRFDSSLKLGYVFPELPFQSLGFQSAYSLHKQDSYFGLSRYNIDHESSYTNLQFSSIIGDTRSKFKTGVTFAYDGYTEMVNAMDFSRVDKSIGAFFEYSYDDLKKLSLTAGVRADSHNNLGSFITPRLHVRYLPWERGSIKASVGRGRKAANIFAENQQMFGSAREIKISGQDGNIYGLDAEDAWNYGVGILQGFTLFQRSGNIALDYYITDFNNQVVVDWEDPQAISFYNLEGKSAARSFQIEVNHELLENVEVRTAYKFYDVETDYVSGALQKPLQAQHRFFANVGYVTNAKENGSQWRADYTLHTLGKQRLPSTASNPAAYQLGEYSPSFSLMNAQITKVFSDNFEIYIGGENLTDYVQDLPVIGAENPFGTNFDTTIIYGPTMGRMFYTGFRYKL